MWRKFLWSRRVICRLTVIDAPGQRAPQTLLYISSTPNFFIVLIEYPLFRCLSCWVNMACFVNFEFLLRCTLYRRMEVNLKSRTLNQFPSEAASTLMFSLCIHRTSLPTSRRSSTRSTTRPGIASSAATSAHTSRTRLATSFISISARSPSCCSRAVKFSSRCTSSIHTAH